MAKTKSEEKPVLERTYNIPLRREFLKVPRYKRAKKAVTAIREFLQRHMKSDDIRIQRNLNLAVWEKGIRNPPHHVKVNASKDKEGIVRAELLGAGPDRKEIAKAEEKAKKELKQKAAEEKAEPKAEKAEVPKPEAQKAAEAKPKAEKAEVPKPEAQKAAEAKPKAEKAEVPKPEAQKAAQPKPAKAAEAKPEE